MFWNMSPLLPLLGNPLSNSAPRLASHLDTSLRRSVYTARRLRFILRA